MTALTYIEGIGQAGHCEAAKVHRPKPLRWVYHHILPLACGGKTEPDNLAQLCDNDHYAIHELMWLLANGGIPPSVKGSRAQMTLAQRGYAAALALGTERNIPKEA